MPYSNRANPWSVTLHPFEVLDKPQPISIASTKQQRCPTCGRRRSMNQFRADPRDTRSKTEATCYECRRGK